MTDFQVTVIIPCYNSEQTIYRAIKSVLDSSFQPYEILVYDDNSTDGTIEVIEENFSDNAAVKVFKGVKNKGAGNARNELIKKAGGNFIAFLDSDDFWYEKKLEDQVKAIESGNYDIITCGYDVFDENGQFLGSRSPIKTINNYTMHLTNWLPTSMTVFRKNLEGAQEMPLIRRRQDYGFWLRIFKNNKKLKCYVIDKPLGGYLRRSDSLSSSKVDNLKFNFRLFREVMKYSFIFSIILVFFNAAIRILRK